MDRHHYSVMEATTVLCVVLGVFTLLPCLTEVSGVRTPSRRLNMTFVKGDRDATLTCNVRGIGKKRVIWRRLSDPIPIAVGTTKYWPGKKYRARRQGDNWQLIIKNVDHRDAGEYECRLTGRGDVADILSIIMPSDNHLHFLPTPTTVATRIGGDVTLPCHINNLRKSLVMWTKTHVGGPKVLSLRKKIHSGDKRHKVLHTQRPEWSLGIRRVQPSDLGVYRCVVNTVPPLTRTVELVEGKPDKQPEGGDKLPDVGQSQGGGPVLVEDTFKDYVEVTQNKAVTLTCQFTGTPQPNIVWERRVWDQFGEKKIEDLKTKGETYTLTNAQPQDSGVYVCKASNGSPPPAQGRIRVKVNEVITTTTPEPTTTTFDPIGNAAPRTYVEQNVVYQTRGREAELECKAVGVPRPLIRWLDGNTPIQNTYKFDIQNRERRHHTVISTLYIRSLSSADFGKYTCYAVNKFGDDRATVVLAERIEH